MTQKAGVPTNVTAIKLMVRYNNSETTRREKLSNKRNKVTIMAEVAGVPICDSCFGGSKSQLIENRWARRNQKIIQ